MKKVRIMLSAIAVLAVVGGTLAFTNYKKTQLKVFQITTVGGQCEFKGLYNPSILGDPRNTTFTNATISATTTTVLPAASCTLKTVTVIPEQE